MKSASAPAGHLPSRRIFMQTSAAFGAGLVLGVGCLREGDRGLDVALTDLPEFEPNAFVRIAPDNTVTVISKHIEFGQGSFTGLATIVAEELDADWSQVRVEAAPADPTRYANLTFGKVQGTGGSTAIANSWMQLREAGATARAMLVNAAAQKWKVPAGEITVKQGVISHAASERSARFGELTEAAAALPVPQKATLKDPKTFTLIGRDVPRVDAAEKTNGKAVFTLDVNQPGLLTAVLARPARFGATVKNFDATAAKKVDGVQHVVQVPQGIAVVARDFWSAKKGRDALNITWDESQAETRSTPELFTEYRALSKKPGLVADKRGDLNTAMKGAVRTLEATYEFPFLAHAPMEPLDCVIKLGDGMCEIWAGSQIPTLDQMVVGQVLGITPDKVKINTLLGGGSFGRRATPNSDVFGEAASIAKAVGGKTPIKLVWTREDDIRGGRYRPLYVHRLRAGLDADGRIVGWEHRIVGQSINAGSAFAELMIKDGIDVTSVEGAVHLPYDIPNLQVELHTTATKVPVLWWRSVGSTHTAYSTEMFLDEIARATKQDPVELRRKLMKNHPRELGVLNLVAEKSGWGSPLPVGKGRGVAVHKSFGSYVAQVAEVSVGADGMPKTERVVCAVDCGTAINPDNIRAQMEGGIGFGLGAALYDAIDIEEGRPVQSNFHNYPSLRIDQMPPVEVHIVASGEAPTGVGEPGTPPIAPAVGNAFAQLTGKTIRVLPFQRSVKA